jgi:hypothetical protein
VDLDEVTEVLAAKAVDRVCPACGVAHLGGAVQIDIGVTALAVYWYGAVNPARVRRPRPERSQATSTSTARSEASVASSIPAARAQPSAPPYVCARAARKVSIDDASARATLAATGASGSG